jgi:hypothetical protein
MLNYLLQTFSEESNIIIIVIIIIIKKYIQIIIILIIYLITLILWLFRIRQCSYVPFFLLSIAFYTFSSFVFLSHFSCFINFHVFRLLHLLLLHFHTFFF